METKLNKVESDALIKERESECSSKILLLQNIFFFSELPSKDILSILHLAKVFTFQTNELIDIPSTYSNSFFLVETLFILKYVYFNLY